MPTIAEKIAAAAEASARYRVALFGPAGNACGVWVRTGRAVAEDLVARWEASRAGNTATVEAV